jgi:hypothetical protein
MIRKSKPKLKNVELLLKFLGKKLNKENDLVSNKYTKQDHKL